MTATGRKIVQDKAQQMAVEKYFLTVHHKIKC